MRRHRTALPAVITALTILAALLSPLPAMAVEEPAFKLLRTLGAVELREYPSYVVAETVVDGRDFDRAGNEGFRRLAGYIFGGNRAAGAAGGSQKIAMTAPVAQRPRGGSERIAMTAPVAQRGGAQGWVVAFTMPAASTLATLPAPNDSRVTLREVPVRTVAALRFSGFWSEGRFAARIAELLATVRAAGWTVIGGPETARYDPPFMPWFLRRNEVMVEVAAP